MISTAKSDTIYLYVWSGDAKAARDLVGRRYPGVEIREFPHRKLRESGFRERVRLLRGLRGRAAVFYFESLDHFRYRLIVESFHWLHRCQETVLCDSGGRWETLRSADVLRSAPGVWLRMLLDLKTLLFWWCYLQLRLLRAAPVFSSMDGGDFEIAYLIPSLAAIGPSGGAISHIRGFLYGLKGSGRTCRVFSGVPLAQEAYEAEIVASPSRAYFFWEAFMLSYNQVFARGVAKRLASAKPGAFYQRHCRFAIAGALLSRRLKVPLILEYNGPEVWMADHWDPTPFGSWIKLCEEVSLRSAARIIVVSDVLREELKERGIRADRIVVNSNGVDPDYFYPGRGRQAGRRELAAGDDEVLIGFAGSFSLWHGIDILQQAIVRLLSNPSPCRLRFVLMGNGLLHGEMRSALAAYEKTGEVIFTGSLSSHKVAEYLDACDILISPHIPMPDGSRFFGSPTKIFEYMAMGKSIIASRLEQLAEVLEHDRTAWLVTPGDVDELTRAILRLALDREKRAELGIAARRTAVERHSWALNVRRALSGMSSEKHHGRGTLSTADGPILLP